MAVIGVGAKMESSEAKLRLICGSKLDLSLLAGSSSHRGRQDKIKVCEKVTEAKNQKKKRYQMQMGN